MRRRRHEISAARRQQILDRLDRGDWRAKHVVPWIVATGFVAAVMGLAVGDRSMRTSAFGCHYVRRADRDQPGVGPQDSPEGLGREGGESRRSSFGRVRLTNGADLHAGVAPLRRRSYGKEQSKDAGTEVRAG
jgi:hypothetical protein